MSKETNIVTDAIDELPADVRDMNLNLDPVQKVRTVALMLGIKYYTDTIIKDATYLQLMMSREKEMKFSNEPDAALWHLRPASVNGVIACAQEFENFLLGNRSAVQSIKIGDETIHAANAGVGE